MFDISPRISPKTAVFPGDIPFSRSVSLHFEKGDNLELSSIQTTLHIGAHADAPSHYSSQGMTIESCDLNRYIGPCSVVEVQASRGARFGLESIDKSISFTPRILFKTNSFNDPNQWVENFNSLEPDFIHELADHGVKLIGIDTPSVDPWDSKTLPSHQALFSRNLSVLEGLILKDVPEGEYFLVALPLSIEGADASPVRAVLWSKDHVF